MTAYYASWYREVLLRKATDFQREVIFSPNKDSFANFIQQGHMIGMMNPEDYTNPQVQNLIRIISDNLSATFLYAKLNRKDVIHFKDFSLIFKAVYSRFKPILSSGR